MTLARIVDNALAAHADTFQVQHSRQPVRATILAPTGERFVIHQEGPHQVSWDAIGGPAPITPFRCGTPLQAESATRQWAAGVAPRPTRRP